MLRLVSLAFYLAITSVCPDCDEVRWSVAANCDDTLWTPAHSPHRNAPPSRHSNTHCPHARITCPQTTRAWKQIKNFDLDHLNWISSELTSVECAAALQWCRLYNEKAPRPPRRCFSAHKSVPDSPNVSPVPPAPCRLSSDNCSALCWCGWSISWYSCPDHRHLLKSSRTWDDADGRQQSPESVPD